MHGPHEREMPHVGGEQRLLFVHGFKVTSALVLCSSWQNSSRIHAPGCSDAGSSLGGFPFDVAPPRFDMSRKHSRTGRRVTPYEGGDLPGKRYGEYQGLCRQKQVEDRKNPPASIWQVVVTEALQRGRQSIGKVGFR